MKNLDLGIFDMDGLMLDTERRYADDIERVMRQLGVTVNMETLWESIGSSEFDEERFFVHIPAGIDDRQILNVRGEGNKGLNGGHAGDLHVVVNVRPHPFFERDGFDVWCEVHVNLVQATLGDTLMVPTLDGKVKYDIPEGTQPGSVFRLKGKGIQNIRSKARGDQLVRIIVDIPTKLNSEQREALLKFNSLMGGSTPTGEEKKGFFGKKRK